MYEAGLPPEMFSVVTGLPEDVGDEMITNPHAELITFTGGVPVGKLIAERAGYRRTVLELGGNAPFIVMDDADLKKAAEHGGAGGHQELGTALHGGEAHPLHRQRWPTTSPSWWRSGRPRSNYGDPMDPETDMGTVIHEGAAQLFERRVNDAVEAGAELLYGNHRQGRALLADGPRPRAGRLRAGARGDLRAPVIPMIRVQGPGRGDPGGQLDRLRPLLGRLHPELGAHPTPDRRAQDRHGQRLGGPRLPHRDVALRRHQGLRARLQGRRGRSHEELHHGQVVLPALGLI